MEPRVYRIYGRSLTARGYLWRGGREAVAALSSNPRQVHSLFFHCLAGQPQVDRITIAYRYVRKYNTLFNIHINIQTVLKYAYTSVLLRRSPIIVVRVPIIGCSGNRVVCSPPAWALGLYARTDTSIAWLVGRGGRTNAFSTTAGSTPTMYNTWCCCCCCCCCC